jgi:hypothetical protein
MIYETTADESAERRIAAYVSTVYGVTMWKTPQFAVVDYIATRDGAPVGLVEIKCRSMSIEEIDARGGYLISLNKLKKMRMLSEMLKIPSVLVVKFKDKVYEYITHDFGYDGVVPFNRNDRPDEREMAAVLYTTRFRRMR